MESKNVPEMAELLRDAPKNWGKWGPTTKSVHSIT